MKIRKTIITTILMLLTVLILTPSSNAVYNSNGDPSIEMQPQYWITPIRQLETLGGGMGLTETLNEDLSSSSGSNNIDVHMEKNTEYGAMAILTVSSYGNPNTIPSAGGSSTGNETGIIYGTLECRNYAGGTLYGESTASSIWYTSERNHIYEDVNPKYVDLYYGNSSNPTPKIGDATIETKGWQNNRATYQWGTDTHNGFYRGDGSIFAYYSHWYMHSQCFGTARAAVVCGEGI